MENLKREAYFQFAEWYLGEGLLCEDPRKAAELFHRAVQSYQQAAPENPGLGDAQRLYGTKLYELGDYQEAVKNLFAAIKTYQKEEVQDERVGYAAAYLGLSYLKLNNITQANKALTTAKKIASEEEEDVFDEKILERVAKAMERISTKTR